MPACPSRFPAGVDSSPPSSLIQASGLIYSCSLERAGAAPLEAASAALLTELAPALIGLGRERRRDNDQTIAITMSCYTCNFFDGLVEFAKILSSASLPETHVLLAIVVCRSLLQKFILLRGLLPEPGATL